MHILKPMYPPLGDKYSTPGIDAMVEAEKSLERSQDRCDVCRTLRQRLQDVAGRTGSRHAAQSAARDLLVRLRS